MALPAQRTLRLRKFLFAGLLLLILISVSLSLYQHHHQWVIPESAKRRVNPLPPTESNLRSARVVYDEDCAQCHGSTGKGDGPEARLHDPLPADLIDPRTTSHLTDGEIFYQISEGRRPMPSFKRRLTEDERWQLVLLVRSFSAPVFPNTPSAGGSASPPKP